MNDAQTWTLIAGFLALMSAMVAMTLRVVKAEITTLGTRIDGRIDTLEARFDHLDRDVQTIVTRLTER